MFLKLQPNTKLAKWVSNQRINTGCTHRKDIIMTLPHPGTGKLRFRMDQHHRHAAWEDRFMSLPTIAKSTDTAMFLNCYSENSKLGRWVETKDQYRL
jgi:hypothetical protein